MTRRLCRLILPCLIAAGTLSSGLTPNNALAGDTDIDSIVADEYEAELCGWGTGTCGWGTHDSAPVQVEAEVERSSRTTRTTRTAATFDKSLATVAAAACASAGISVEQIVEPFVMVGPQLSKSLDQVKKFQQWWETAAEQQAESTEADLVAEEFASENEDETFQANHVPIVDFDSEIPADAPWAEGLVEDTATGAIDFELESEPRDDQSILVKVDDEQIRQDLDDLVSEEPIDAMCIDSAAFGPSILALDSVKETNETESKIAATVGSSPVIFSIAEAYLPYDLAVRDLHSNGVLSMSKRPFCIRARMELPEFDLAFDNLYPTAAFKRDEVETQVVVKIDPDFAISGSADCLLDDWVWKATLALENGGSVRKWLRPDVAGRQVVALVVKHNLVASGLVNRLAQVWPRNDQPRATPGAQLLARAEAVEAGEEEPNAGTPNFDTQQLAQATATLKEWVSTVETAVTTLTSRWLPRLAQVPPSPKDSGETSRR